MGIFTSRAIYENYTSSNYTDVEPYHGDHFNYHELGIIAAAESAANQNAFMKAIALQELAALEQTGNTDIFYESVNIKGFFDKVKAFFKKIIEKIHKIFHTFIAKMQSWFGNNKDFVKKYEKEIVKNWGLVSNDWEFKNGYTFMTKVGSNDVSVLSQFTKEKSANMETAITTAKNGDKIKDILKASTDANKFASALKPWSTQTPAVIDGKVRVSQAMNGDNVNIILYTVDGKTEVAFKPEKDFQFQDSSIVSASKFYTIDTANEYSGDTSKLKPAITITTPAANKITKLFNSGTADTAAITKFREDFNEKGKDQIRYQLVEAFKQGYIIIEKINIDFDNQGSYDSKEFTEELHKTFYGEDKEDLNKSAIEKCYGGSITNMLTFIRDYDKIKGSIENAEKNLIQTLDNRIKAIDTAQDNILKDKSADASVNEAVIQISTVFQSFWGFIKECETQAFATILQGLKDACSQAKQIAVKVIGLKKEMKEESYDYSSENHSYNGFIESVKLV